MIAAQFDHYEYSMLGLDLQQAQAAQDLLTQLKQESDTFELAEVRDSLAASDQSAVAAADLKNDDRPAKTWLIWAKPLGDEEGGDAVAIGMASIADGEVGLAILAAFQGHGLGQSTLAAMVVWAEEAGYDRLWLDVDLENQVARHLYKKLGFTEVGEEPEPIELRSGRQANLVKMELLF